MAKLDYQYISNLIDQAKENDSNAFAELYAASYPSVYTFSCTFLNDTQLAKETLSKTYVQAFSSLYQLSSNGIFILWLLQINCNICLEYVKEEKQIQIDTETYSFRQLLTLPISESVATIMKYYNNLSIHEIAKIMDISSRRVNISIARAKRRLRMV